MRFKTYIWRPGSSFRGRFELRTPSRFRRRPESSLEGSMPRGGLELQVLSSFGEPGASELGAASEPGGSIRGRLKLQAPSSITERGWSFLLLAQSRGAEST